MDSVPSEKLRIICELFINYWVTYFKMCFLSCFIRGPRIKSVTDKENNVKFLQILRIDFPYLKFVSSESWIPCLGIQD